MDVGARLSSVGLTQVQFAEKLGVSKQAVSNWVSRGTVSDEGEVLLASMEGEAKGRISVGVLVDTDEGPGRVVRRDRCELLDGRVEWIYWVGIAKETPNGWVIQRGAHQFPEYFLRKPREVRWVDKNSQDISK